MTMKSWGLGVCDWPAVSTTKKMTMEFCVDYMIITLALVEIETGPVEIKINLVEW
jgi:hypothetical protein